LLAVVRSYCPGTADVVAIQQEIRVPLCILLNEETILFSANVYPPWLQDDSVVGHDELGAAGADTALHAQWMHNGKRTLFGDRSRIWMMYLLLLICLPDRS